MSEQMLSLIEARELLKVKVLAAMVADTSDDFSEPYAAWREVDKAAVRLARVRRQYNKHVRAVVSNASAARTRKP